TATLASTVLRLSLLDALPILTSTDYTLMQVASPIVFSIVLGLSAGIFEEVTRYVLMRFVMYKRTWQSGFFFGAGHGVIEAIIFRSEELTSELQSRFDLVCRLL